MKYLIKKRFYRIEYNQKRQSHKLKTFEEGTYITERMYNLLKKESQKQYITIIND